jgi:hypothetical protein
MCAFSKVLSIVALHRKHTTTLTFENFLQVRKPIKQAAHFGSKNGVQERNSKEAYW